MKPVPLVLLLLVGGSAAAAYFLWPSSAGPAVSLPTAGTLRMTARLEKMVRAWNEVPFVMEEDAWFRANRPAWIPGFRRKLEGNQNFQEVLMLRHKLALAHSVPNVVFWSRLRNSCSVIHRWKLDGSAINFASKGS